MKVQSNASHVIAVLVSWNILRAKCSGSNTALIIWVIMKVIWVSNAPNANPMCLRRGADDQFYFES